MVLGPEEVETRQKLKGWLTYRAVLRIFPALKVPLKCDSVIRSQQIS